MHLYEIQPSDQNPVYAVARNPQEATNLFVTWSAATDRVHETVAIRDFPIGDLHPNRQQQVRSAFALGVIGILYLNEDAGWSFSPPMWLPLTDDELSAPQIDGGER